MENTDNGDGIRAMSNVSRGNNWGAIYAINSGTSPVIYSQSSAGPAAYLAGNVTVTGTLSKGGGSFMIDHPLDPENKYLYHSFVESPDTINIYNGNVATDARGYATIELPDWFEALNREFRYQLTIVDEGDDDEFVAAKVVRPVQGNTLTIHTSAPGITVSRRVTGIRKDPWAETNRIPVVVDKPESDRVRYLRPEAYGADASRALSGPKALTTGDLDEDGVIVEHNRNE